MFGLHFLVKVIAQLQIQDTQCGFKLFTRRSAQLLWGNLHIERWAFDLELLILAVQFRVPLSEVPVNWLEIDGSHLDPLDASIQIGIDMLRVRLLYLTGVWSKRVWRDVEPHD
jgi:dolichyl-phosphate beta-glucosyltransferase